MKLPDTMSLDRLLTALEAIKAGPNEEELKTAPLLDFWSAVVVEDVPRLVGIAIDHPDLPRTEIATSMLLFISKDKSHARTLSRWYRLGPKDESNRARLDRNYMKKLNLKTLASHRQCARAATKEASLRFGDDALIERARALGS